MENQTPIDPEQERILNEFMAKLEVEKKLEREKLEQEQEEVDFSDDPIFSRLLENEKRLTKQEDQRDLEIIPFPGIFSDIYFNILENSTIPRPETAYASTLAIMSTLIGRMVSLNEIMPTVRQFIIMPSAFGKNIVMEATKRILHSLGLGAVIGSSSITSETSLIDEFGVRPLCPELLSMTDECYTMLKNLNKFGVEGAINQLATMKHGDWLQTRRMVSLMGIKRQSNLGAGIQSPYFSFVGLTTPERFYSSLPRGVKESGFFNRFIFWTTNKVIYPKIISSKSFSRAIDSCKQLKDILFFDERQRRMNMPPSKDGSLPFKHELPHHQLQLSSDGYNYFEKKSHNAYDEIAKLHLRGLPPRQDLLRLSERLLCLATIAHVSLHGKDLLNHNVDEETMRMVSMVDKDIHRKSTEGFLSGLEKRQKMAKQKAIKMRIIRAFSLNETPTMSRDQLSKKATFKRKRLPVGEIDLLVMEGFLTKGDDNKLCLNEDSTEVRTMRSL